LERKASLLAVQIGAEETVGVLHQAEELSKVVEEQP